VVVSAGEYRIYHAGDTLLFTDMSLIAELWRPTTALLPIGDRFTMDPTAAARAASLIRPKLAMPMHFGTFPLLTGTPEQFEHACQEVDVPSKTLQPGESCAAA
jgi:L-ascorbate metabolism protein UlaG (beta-lactamase superfamily)